MPGDPDSGGVLVNIDWSMQEQQEREDQFVDASDHISSEVRTPKLGESAAMVEVGETSRRRRSREQDLERVQARLDASSAECRKYKVRNQSLIADLDFRRFFFFEFRSYASRCCDTGRKGSFWKGSCGSPY